MFHIIISFQTPIYYTLTLALALSLSCSTLSAHQVHVTRRKNSWYCLTARYTCQSWKGNRNSDTARQLSHCPRAPYLDIPASPTSQAIWDHVVFFDLCQSPRYLDPTSPPDCGRDSRCPNCPGGVTGGEPCSRLVGRISKLISRLVTREESICLITSSPYLILQ